MIMIIYLLVGLPSEGGYREGEAEAKKRNAMYLNISTHIKINSWGYTRNGGLRKRKEKTKGM